MLIEFNFENFMSFKDEAKLSMLAVKSFKEHTHTHAFALGEHHVLKSAIIFGNNGGGKSNIIMAIGFMKRTLINSYKNALDEENEQNSNLPKFALNSANDTKPCNFEVVFVNEGSTFRYGFSIDNNFVVSEWLFQTFPSKTKEKVLFTREGQKFEINKESFEEGHRREGDVKENVLFLSLLASLGKEKSLSVVEWFKNINIIDGNFDFGIKKYTSEKLKIDPVFRKWVTNFINFLEISKIEVVEDENQSFNFSRWLEKDKNSEIGD